MNYSLSSYFGFIWLLFNLPCLPYVQTLVGFAVVPTVAAVDRDVVDTVKYALHLWK